MFGGQGVYSGELMFALEARGELYLKTDENTRTAFRAAGSHPFVYETNGRPTQTSYWRLPDGAVDDPGGGGAMGPHGLGNGETRGCGSGLESR